MPALNAHSVAVHESMQIEHVEQKHLRIQWNHENSKCQVYSLHILFHIKCEPNAKLWSTQIAKICYSRYVSLSFLIYALADLPHNELIAICDLWVNALCAMHTKSMNGRIEREEKHAQEWSSPCGCCECDIDPSLFALFLAHYSAIRARQLIFSNLVNQKLVQIYRIWITHESQPTPINVCELLR